MGKLLPFHAAFLAASRVGMVKLQFLVMCEDLGLPNSDDARLVALTNRAALALDELHAHIYNKAS